MGEIVLAKRAAATIQQPDQMLYFTDISDQLLARILHSEWPHEQVLAAPDVQNVKRSSAALKSTHERPHHLAEVLLAAQIGCIVGDTALLWDVVPARMTKGMTGAPFPAAPSEDLLAGRLWSMPGAHYPEGILVSVDDRDRIVSVSLVSRHLAVAGP